ncbi:MAG: ATP-binding protein [Sneathiella sp.]|nr:ATP-binding protein [Sneathiella sp.]
MSKVFLVVGPAGSGKTTFSKDLASREDAHIFSVDDWLNTLFMMDMPSEQPYKWARERAGRIEKQILSEALKLLDKRLNVILDLGFFSKEQRKRVPEFIRSHGHEAITYFLDAEPLTRWERIEARDTAKTVTLNIPVTRDVFDFCETIFEPLDEEEKKRAMVYNG